MWTDIVSVLLAQEGGGDAGVDGDVQAGGVDEFAAGEDEHGVGDVLGQHLALEQGPLGVERARGPPPATP